MRVGILGAGSIGCYLGGRLIAAGQEVVLVGRLAREVKEHGLTLTDYTGARVALPPHCGHAISMQFDAPHELPSR